MIGFQKQNPEVQKNVNSENPRVLKKNYFHWTKIAGKIISLSHSHLNSRMSSAELTEIFVYNSKAP